MKRGLVIAGLIMAAAAVIWLFRGRPRSHPLPPKPRTVEDVLAAIGPQVDSRLRPVFARAGVAYPPRQLAILVFKREKRLELHAADGSAQFRFVSAYPILAASGGDGPKLREGDLQVPEGFYRIELLNPNSLYHLSLRVDYPNAEDVANALAEGRDPAGLGGDIMIHGGAASVGCLAMGDPVAEDLFVLAARTGLDAMEVVMSPRDFRTSPPEENAGGQVADLYARLAESLGRFPAQSAFGFQ